MKKILVIDESSLFLDYMTKKLEEHGFEVVQGRNGLDGSVKLRSEIPDLVIMDYFLSRKSSVELLKEKKANPNVTDIPVIVTASKIDKSQLVQCAKYGAKKFFSKPVRIDGLLKSVSNLLNVEVSIDSTPCIIEAHLNEEILFIEIARGLNSEKTELLKYKIAELKDLYELKNPRVLLMMSDIELTEDDTYKFDSLLKTIVEHAGNYARHMKILTASPFVRNFVESRSEYKAVGVSDNLAKAMDDLLGLKPDNVAHDEVVRERLLSASAPKKEKDETFQLRFDAEHATPEGDEEGEKKPFAIAVVDDDVIIQKLVQTVFQSAGWKVDAYNNGNEFVKDLGDIEYGLVFLDLMMPEMDGFQVLELLNSTNVKPPIIVLSALSQQEAVVRAMKLGVYSYLTKPFKPEMLVRKTAELLNANF